MISGSIGISLNPNHNFQQDSIDKLKDILQKWFEEDGEDADFRFDKNEFLLEAGFAFFGHGDLFWDTSNDEEIEHLVDSFDINLIKKEN